MQCFDVLLSDMAAADGTLEIYLSEDGYLNKHLGTSDPSGASPLPSGSPADVAADQSKHASTGVLHTLSHTLSRTHKPPPPSALMGRWHWTAAELCSAPNGTIMLRNEPLLSARHTGAHVSLELQLFRLIPAGNAGLPDQGITSVPAQGWAFVRSEQKIQSTLRRVFSHSKLKVVESFTPSHAAPARQETAAWLNYLLEAMWPFICEYTETLIRSFEPMIKASLPSFLGSVSFTTVSLGREPLSFDKFAVSRTEAGEARLEMDVLYNGNSDIALKTVAGSLGIKTLQIRGRLTIVMGPIFAAMPLMKALQVLPRHRCCGSRAAPVHRAQHCSSVCPACDSGECVQRKISLVGYGWR